MSRRGKNLEEYNDKKCESLKNSRMAEEGNSSNVAERVVPRKVCVQFKRWGSCASGERCGFSHDTTSGSVYGPCQSIGVRQGSPAKMIACRHFGSGTVCPLRNECQFHHVETKKTHSDKLLEANRPHSDVVEPMRSVDSRNKLKKTRLCANWERTGTCCYGSLCKFAHGIAELQSVGSSNPQQLETSAGISAPANSLAPNAIGSSAPPKKKGFD